MPIGRSTSGKATPAVPWHARCMAPAEPRTLDLDGGARRRRHRAHPTDHARRPPRARRRSTNVSRPTAGTCATSPPKPTLSPSELDHFTQRRLRRPRRARRRGARRVHRVGELRAVGEPRRRRGRRSWSTTSTTAGASPHCCSNTSRRSPGRTGSRGSRPRCWPRTGPCCRCSARAGWPLQRRFESGVIDLDFELADTSEFLDSVERREQRADSRAMARLLLASSIAVIGASDTADTVGQCCGATPRAVQRSAVPGQPEPRHDRRSPRLRHASATSPTTSRWRWSPCRPGSWSPTIDQCIAKRVRGAVIVTEVGDTGRHGRDRRRTPVATGCA